MDIFTFINLHSIFFLYNKIVDFILQRAQSIYHDLSRYHQTSEFPNMGRLTVVNVSFNTFYRCFLRICCRTSTFVLQIVVQLRRAASMQNDGGQNKAKIKETLARIFFTPPAFQLLMDKTLIFRHINCLNDFP